ncbi:MAG: STAS domain-containing protein [Solirubrobacterales bacterium]
MERHHMKMAASVFAGSADDAPSDVAGQTQTVFNDNGEVPTALREAGFDPPSVARRMHTLVLTGSLDRGSVHQLEEEIERLCEEGVTGITLDLRGLLGIDAIGVAVVAFRCRLCLRRGYDFALVRGPRIVQRAFEHAGLSELLPFEDARLPLQERTQLVDELASGELVATPPARVLTARLQPVASGGLS